MIVQRLERMQRLGGEARFAVARRRQERVERGLDIALLGDPALAFNQDIAQSGNAYPPAPPRRAPSARAVVSWLGSM